MSGLAVARNDLRRKQLTFRWRISSVSHDYSFLLLALGAWFLYRIVVNAFPREGIEVSFLDLSAASGATDASRRSLTGEILALLEDPEPIAVRGLQMNTMPGTDQPAFGVIRPAIAMTQASDFSSSKYPFKMGVFEFGLEDFSRIVNRVCGWPREGTLVGWLSSDGDSSVSGAELSKRGFRRGHGKEPSGWFATATGNDGREEALASIAAQILVDARQNKYTGSWQSLKACQQGIKTMRVTQSGADSKRAREYFELALRHDSSNWIARFYVAVSFCGEEVGKPTPTEPGHGDTRHVRVR
jgi:hypothetical protein